MATTGQADITVTSNWVDITVSNPSLANTDCSLQNISPSKTINVAGGATATGSGHRLKPGDNILINASNIWVKCERAESNDKLVVSLV